jgi:hypothetical protein
MRKLPIQTTAAIFCGLFTLILIAASSAHAAQHGFETPGPVDVKQIYPELWQGPAHQVKSAKPVDGLLLSFEVSSKHGEYQVFSGLALKKLLKEFEAIEAMEKVDEDETLGDSVKESVNKTAKSITNLFTDPVGSITGAAKGLGRLLDRTGESFKGRTGHGEDSGFERIVGLSKSKREVAAKFGVDPYSDNPALQEQLNRIANADFIGGFGLGAALSGVPGGAGMLLTTAGSTRILGELIRNTPPAELRIRNEKKLTGMGVNKDLAELFIGNQAYSPLNQTMLVLALEAMPQVKNLNLFVKVACHIQNPEMAFVIAQMAVLYSGYHKRVAKLESFKPLARFLYAKTQNGKAAVVFPADYILWTGRLAGAAQQVAQEAALWREPGVTELWITGRLSPACRRGLKEANWIIIEKAWDHLVKAPQK